MDVDDLRTFLAVTDEGGFRAAARSLFASQPSVSRAVTRLEAELGVPLFVRGKAGASLTAHGRALRAGVPRILATMERVRQQAVGHEPEVLRLGAAPTAAGSFLARFLSTWIPQHPELRIVMVHDGAARLRTRLERDECDAAVVAAPIPESFEHRHVTTVRVTARLPVEHPLAQSSEPLSVVDLDQQPILVNGRRFLTTELLLAACHLVGSSPLIVYECDVSQTLAALAEAGLGIAIMGDNVDLRGFDLPRREIHNGDGTTLTFDLHIAWRRDAELSPVALQFLNELAAS